MFDGILVSIRSYIIAELASQVAADITENGLTVEDESIVDSVINPPEEASPPLPLGEPVEPVANPFTNPV